MKTKIGMTFGLALMLVVGVMATMLALGMFATGLVEAGHSTSGTSVTSPTAAASPNDPGAATKMTFTFVTGVKLDALTDTIIIEFDDDVEVPTVIDPSTVTISASAITNAGTDVTGTAVNNPLDVTVTLVGTPKDEPVVTLTVPDMDSSTSSPSLNSILAGATVTVIFRQTAGLINPTESKDGNSSFAAHLSTNEEPGEADASYHIPRQILLSSADGERGKTITVTGKGFENSTTATVWRDANQDGARDATETTLASALVGSDNIFVATFVMSSPPFAVGPGTTTNDANAINAIDGEDNRINPSDSNYSSSDIPILGYQGKLNVTPTTASIGDTVTIELSDFDPNTLVTNFSKRTIGTQTITPTSSSATTDGNGDLTFDFVIPNGLPAGKVTINIDTGTLSGNEAKDITITGAVLLLTPSEVVPNQTLTIIGSGFSTSETINAASDDSLISIGGDTTDLKAVDGSKSDKFNENASVTTDNGGNWSSSLIIPVNTTTTTTGTLQLKVKDNGGREGLVELSISERTLVIDPVLSRVGTVVNVTGSGYPADNTKSGAETTPSVSIRYVVGSTTNTVATLTADAAGNIAGSFKVPLGATIPSTNSVRAVYTIPGTSTEITTSSVHDVPEATLTIDPVSGPPGTTINITANGFKTFSTVSTLELGDIDVRPAPVPSTDDNGSFSATLLVPQLNTGAQTVKATVSGTTASVSFTVTEAAAVAATPEPSAEQTSEVAFATLIDNDIDGNPNLISVFLFDNATQEWSSFDPDPDFAEFNDLTTVSGGKIVWVRVRSAQDFNGEALVEGWNQIVMP
ncbi:MAG: hypothetical protein BZY88_06760 [SAR202 cluster bacterium Io17-Chloro-G9]|nr:MAG: hypothetical protein BZY88_06760 [SAR202 cluster bacterium Io17-Chloro-G9]